MTRVELAGLTSPASAVAFLYDTSLPPALRERAEAEIARSIGRTDRKERFSVIGFGDRGSPASFSTTLVLAVPENVRGVSQWLNSGRALLFTGAAKESPLSAALDVAVRQARRGRLPSLRPRHRPPRSRREAGGAEQESGADGAGVPGRRGGRSRRADRP